MSAVDSLRDSNGIAPVIHVIDNDHSGGASLVERLPPEVAVIPTDSNIGFAGGVNVAFEDCSRRHPDAEFIAVGAHDIHVEADTLLRLVLAAGDAPRFAVLGPVFKSETGRHAGGTWNGWRARHEREALAPIAERDWVMGALMLIRRSCIARVGGFDASLGSYVEDVDFCLRVRDHGWRVGVVSGARASELGSRSGDVGYLVDVNSAKVAVKRQGLRALPRIMFQYAYWVLRGLVASLHPSRTAERRLASRRAALEHLRAMITLGRTLPELRGYASRHRTVPRDVPTPDT